jgi:predicted glycogen debranching enzyme
MMIDAHVKGTAFGISMDSDGLLSHGPQLTWVDSAVNGQPVNPRAGKAVEIQALWYNAMKIMELLANKYEETAEAERYGRIAEKTRKSFVEKFWNGETDFLLDVVGDAEKDSSLMPNQIIAVALNFSMLDGSKNEKIVDILQRELLTPFGLRTRATNDPKYIGIYAGNRGNRDRAYHNGTVWPWLLGPFVTAYLKAKGFSEFRRELAANFLVPLFSRQITEAGLGYVGEIFDGESPHSPKGCIAQAWSIAEPLIAYVEDVTQIRPKYEKEILKILG